jgi:hypothetical protein
VAGWLGLIWDESENSCRHVARDLSAFKKDPSIVCQTFLDPIQEFGIHFLTKL